MKIDVWSHFLSPAYFRRIEASGTGPAAFLLAHQALHDVEARLRVLDAYGEYRQVLTPVPIFHVDPAAARRVDATCRNNDEMASIVARHGDRFAGFAAATPVADADAACEEAIRSVRDLGALGVQLEADARNVPLHHGRYDALFGAMADMGAAIWLHPVRTPASAGSAPETASMLLWQVFGWPSDTTISVSHLIFAGVFDRHPRLKLIVHHGGGLIPHFSGRLELLPLLARLDPNAVTTLGQLEKPPIEYFRMLYADTALFGAPHGVRCVIDFFGPDRVLFGTDAPFDTQGGTRFIPQTISDVEHVLRSDTDRESVFAGNAIRLLDVSGAPQTRAARHENG